MYEMCYQFFGGYDKVLEVDFEVSSFNTRAIISCKIVEEDRCEYHEWEIFGESLRKDDVEPLEWICLEALANNKLTLEVGDKMARHFVEKFIVPKYEKVLRDYFTEEFELRDKRKEKK